MKAKDLKVGRWYAVGEPFCGVLTRLKLVNDNPVYTEGGELRRVDQMRRGSVYYKAGRVLMQYGAASNSTKKGVLCRHVKMLWADYAKQEAEQAELDRVHALYHHQEQRKAERELRSLVRMLRDMGLRKDKHFHYDTDDLPHTIEVTLTAAGVKKLHGAPAPWHCPRHELCSCTEN